MHKDADKLIIVPELKIDWKGIFEFSDLYKKMKVWLYYEGYGDENDNFIEDKYIERIRPFGKIVEARWYGEKPINDYVSNFISVTFQGIALQDTEVAYEGRKIKMNKGQVILRIKGELILNRQGKFERDSFLKKVHDRKIFRKNIDLYKEELYKKVTDFYTEIKAYLNLHQF